MKKLCIFFHNTDSLGHAHIVYTLIKTLASHEKLDIYCIETGTKKTNLFPIHHFAHHLFLPQGNDTISRRKFGHVLFKILKKRPVFIFCPCSE